MHHPESTEKRKVSNFVSASWQKTGNILRSFLWGGNTEAILLSIYMYEVDEKNHHAETCNCMHTNWQPWPSKLLQFKRCTDAVYFFFECTVYLWLFTNVCVRNFFALIRFLNGIFKTILNIILCWVYKIDPRNTTTSSPGYSCFPIWRRQDIGKQKHSRNSNNYNSNRL